MLIDTHCHLDENYFPEGPDAVIERAKAAGVGGLVVIGVGEDAQSAKNAIALAKRRPDVAATAGIHPHSAAGATAALQGEIQELCKDPAVAAVGEIGLDFFYDNSPREQQEAVFRNFIACAREVKKSIVVHTRDAREKTLEILRSENAKDVGGIIHCYSEDISFAKQVLDMGFYLSFSGIVTFKKAKDIQATAAWAPEDRILVETDSPYLAPVPKRGKPCEPAYVAYTAKKVAQLREMDLEDLCQASTENAIKLFGAGLSPSLPNTQTKPGN